MVLTSLLFQAASAAPVPLSRAPDGPPRATSEARRFVWATRLRLRTEPGGAVRSVLPINQPVDVLEANGAFSRVRGPDGAVGWVASEYLGATPLHYGGAIGHLSGSVGQARVDWAERAAALTPRDPMTLLLLAQAYRTANRPADAATVLARAAQQSAIAPAGIIDGDPPVWFFTSPVTEVPIHEIAPRATGMDDPAVAGRMRGIELWVLPERGPAVQGTVVEVGLGYTSDCPPSQAMVAKVEALLPAGERAIAWTLAEPPPVWHQGVPDVPERVLARAKKKAGPVTGDQWSAARSDDGWRVRLSHQVGTPREDDEDALVRYRIVDYAVADTTVRILHDRETELSMELGPGTAGIDHLLTGRDVDGDGKRDLVLRSECSMTIQLATGEAVTTPGRCCGC